METPVYAKTRIAPTPSGFLHLGNLYTFAFTASLAKKTQSKILLRIDDMDQERVEKKYVQDIFDTLNFIELEWHEGPRSVEEFESNYSQLHRINLYNATLQKLRDEKLIYACNCSRSKILKANNEGLYDGACRHKGIDLDAPNVAWRLDTSKDITLVIDGVDEIIRTDLPIKMKDFIVRKKDGFPSYQVASLVDDIFFGVDLIVRGEDLMFSTLAQMYLATLLEEENFLNASFHHVALLKNKNGEKLSKSAGDTSIQYLRKQGLTSEEIFQKIIGLVPK